MSANGQANGNGQSILEKRRVSIIGMGRLGLCMALQLERAGWDVLGCDVIAEYVASINARTVASNEPGVQEWLRKAKRLRATTSMEMTVDFSDLVLILVATPTGIGHHAYDCGTLSKVLDQIAALRRPRKHVVVCCTVMPGWFADVGSLLLADCPGTTLSYNPEFIAQGAILDGLCSPDLVLIGEGSTEAGDVLQAMYEDATFNTPKVARMSPASAEIMKLALNCYVTTKISFANMIGDIAARTPGADAHDILGAIGADSRVGPKYLKPGFGFGGPCFPRDNRALGLHARAVGVTPSIPDATDAYNKQHAELMAAALLAEGRDEYTIDDVAYKPGCAVDIIEESQPLEVAMRLARAGKRVTIRDRAGIIALVRRTYGRMFEYELMEPNGKALADGVANAGVVDMGNPLSSYSR